MTRRRRVVVTLIVITACMLIASIFLAPVFLNLDHYRPQIISYFEQSTGKKVEIERLAISSDHHSPPKLRRKEPSSIPAQLYSESPASRRRR